MRYLLSIMALMAVMAFVGTARAEDNAPAKKHPAKPDVLKGMVVKVDVANKTIIVKNKAGENTVQVGENTQITVNGQAADINAIQEGMRIEVAPATGTPERISAQTPKAKAENGGKGKGKEGKRKQGGEKKDAPAAE